jgi:nitric oxide dioxygenase
VIILLNRSTIDIIKATVPVLEKYGETITTRFYQLMFANHPELLNIFNHANQKQGRQQMALAGTVYAAAKYIDNLEAILPVVKQIAHKHRSLGIKPEHYPIVGDHLLLAIKDVLGDAATDEIIQAWGLAYNLIADAFISIESEMYEGAAKQKGGWDGFRHFIVDRKVNESDVITSFYLVPEDNQAIAQFLPGQYISIKMEIEGEEYTHIRQYSLSDATGKEYYRISVKRDSGTENPDGMVSNYLHDGVKEGDILKVSAPAGDFVLDTDNNTPVVLLSGGVGITPMMSMLKTIVEIQPERKVFFIHATANGKIHALREEVDKLSEHENVKSFFFYDSPTDEDRKNANFDVEGYVTREWIERNVPYNDADFYFCGPVPFMKVMNQSLQELGVNHNRINYEFFGPKDSLEAPNKKEPVIA